MNAELTVTHFDYTDGSIRTECSTPSVSAEAAMAQQVENNVVGLYPNYTYQTFEGFGCAMTESACCLLSKMEPEVRTDALRCWFGEGGMDARFIRIPLDSCDYSLSEYQAVEDPTADPDLLTFSMERNHKYILPVVKEALTMSGGKVSALLSPWSPPVQWKTPPELTQNDMAVYGLQAANVNLNEPSRCFGGRLKPEFYSAWAKYLVKYVQAYLAEGIPVTMLSIQNEANAATSWDSCLWSSEEESIFLKEHLYPTMKAAGLTDTVGIFIWDHNKERMVEHIDAMMENDIADLVSGFAFHWYSGDHFDALSMLHDRYPGKVLLHSESCGLHIPGKALSFSIPEDMMDKLPEPFLSQLKLSPHVVDFRDAVNYAHDIIGDLNHGLQRWIDWNLCVDRSGGPRHVPGGFAAPIVAEEDGSFSKTISYAYLHQIAQTVTPGSIRIGVSVFSADAEAAAVRRPDGKIGVLLLNRIKEDLPVNIRVSGSICQLVLPAETLSSIILG